MWQAEELAQAKPPPKPAVDLDKMNFDALRPVGDSPDASEDRWAGVAEAPKVRLPIWTPSHSYVR